MALSLIRISLATVFICAMVDTLVTAAMVMLFEVDARYFWIKLP
jgi:hypothetical protein